MNNQEREEEKKQKEIVNHYSTAIVIGFLIFASTDVLIFALSDVIIFGDIISDCLHPKIFSNVFIQDMFEIIIKTAIFTKLYLWFHNKRLQRKL